MIVHLEQLDQAVLGDFEVVIVGAGFAGVETARRLADRGVRSAVLESGREVVDSKFQDLLLLDFAAQHPSGRHNFNRHLPDALAQAGRVRALGGTSAIWSGRWKRLDAEDFAAQPWIPHSGWPIGEADLHPYYLAMEKDFSLPSFDDFAARVSQAPKLPGVCLDFRFDTRKQPLRLAEAFGERLRKDPSILVVLGATVTDVKLSDDLRSVAGVIAHPISGGEGVTVTGKVFVLACGGLETPRLMLASHRQMKAGVGNQNGLVGAFYMDHPKVRAGWLISRQRWLSRWLRMPGKQPGFTVGFSLSVPERRTALTPNHNIFAAAEVRPRNRIGRIAAKAGALFSTTAKFETTLYFEQAPNPESRVRLSHRRDRLGMPGLVLEWKYHADEQAAVVRFARRFADLALASGLANFIFKPADLDLRTASAANHPMGTTRMANDSSEGVVDKNCRVFGISNLFIGGSSVFPTGGNANPTYTLLALAGRLADHIANGLAQRS